MDIVVLVGLFVAGVLEYALATRWTQALVAGHVGMTGGITFVNVLLWGFVVANLRVGDPLAIVTHGLGCALGAAATVWWARRARACEGALDAVGQGAGSGWAASQAATSSGAKPSGPIAPL